MVGFISERVAGFILECMAGFIGIRTPDQVKELAPQLTCNGGKSADGKVRILTSGVNEVAGFATLRGMLLRFSPEFSLAKAGLVSVDPSAVAAAEPAGP